MSIFTEIARFLLTAIAVALAIPTGFAVLSIIDAGSMSMEGFLGVGAISFFLAIAGGVVVGLPVLWVAKRLDWARSLGKMTVVGVLTGAAAAALLTVPFFEGDLSFAAIAVPSWAALGAFAGLVAAPIWVMLHSSDEDAEPA